MKFLLKQQLHYEQEQTIIYFYPNRFSRTIVSEAKRRDLIFDINYCFKNNHKIVQSYEILENDFKRLLTSYKNKILEKRSKFFARPLLDQLILILKYMFTRNLRAKEVIKYSASRNAYDDKDVFLRIALNIAKNIDIDNFKYGWGEDPGTINFEYVYYFELGAKQVSFHSSVLYDDVPEFRGNWIGYRNQTFPFKVRAK